MGVFALLGFFLLVAAVYLALRPFLAPVTSEREEERPPLLVEKERLLDAVRELDTDFATGKLTDEDYRELRVRFTAEAASVMKAIEEGAPALQMVAARSGDGSGTLPPVHEAPPGSAAEQPARATASGAASSLDDELEREIAARKARLLLRACESCGADRDPGDQFCRKCGARLGEPREG